MAEMAESQNQLAPAWNSSGAPTEANRTRSSSDDAVERFAPHICAAPADFVLIVEDDVSVREILAELLDLEGFVSLQAGNAAEALELLQRRERIDALVTDLTMPGDDGVSLIKQARVIRAGLPAILLTGYAEDATVVSASASGSFHILRKPVESDRLIEQLRTLVRPSRNVGCQST